MKNRRLYKSLTGSAIVQFFSDELFHGGSGGMALMLNNISRFPGEETTGGA